MSRFTRFSWGKIWFDDIGPWKDLTFCNSGSVQCTVCQVPQPVPLCLCPVFLQIWSLVIRKQENNPLLLWIILFLLIFIKLQGWLLVLTTFFALWGIYRKRLIVFFDFMPDPSIHVTSRSLYVRQDCHLVWSESHGLAIKVNIQHII